MDYSSSLAEWTHQLSITRFADYGADELCVFSMILSNPTVVNYEVRIRVSSLGVTYVTTQDSPDGSESETLELRLRAGETQETLYADFEHCVRRNGTLWLRFAGTTLLPRWGSE
jgi:hypothetical protein